MTDRSDSSGQKKPPKSLRKPQTGRRRSETGERLTPQLPQRSNTDAQHGQHQTDSDYLQAVIASLTSDADDPQTVGRDSSTSPTRREPTLPKRPVLSNTKTPRPSKRPSTSNRGEDKPHGASRRLSSTDQKYESSTRSHLTGERRLEQLSKLMREFYENGGELAATAANLNASDAFVNAEKRKQYSTNLW